MKKKGNKTKILVASENDDTPVELKMDRYWEKQSKYFLNTDHEGMGAVIYSGMPTWFNKFFDKYQRKTFSELTKSLKLKNKRVLDIGCGVGRWSRVFASKGASVVGIDFEEQRIKKAEILTNKTSGITFEKMSAKSLRFNNNTFDLCNTITVLQHIPYAEKVKAISEIARVTKKGGYVVLIELIDGFDDAKHVFPLTSGQWVSEFKKNGLKVKKLIGNEYSFPLRLLRNLKFIIAGKKTINRVKGDIKLNLFEFLLLRLFIIFSYPLEEISLKVFPYKYARHVGILFQKV